MSKEIDEEIENEVIKTNFNNKVLINCLEVRGTN